CWLSGAERSVGVDATGVGISAACEDMIGRLGNVALFWNVLGLSDVSVVSVVSLVSVVADGIDLETMAPFISRCQPVSAKKLACACIRSSWVVRPAQLSET